jgi:hypothetical protein
MAQIVPAILETTTEAFERSLSLVCKLPGLNRIQVDFGELSAECFCIFVVMVIGSEQQT